MNESLLRQSVCLGRPSVKVITVIISSVSVIYLCVGVYVFNSDSWTVKF